MQYSTLTGEVKREEFQNYPARILQHEVDHLNGVLFIDKMKVGEGQYESRLQRYRERFGNGGAP